MALGNKQKNAGAAKEKTEIKKAPDFKEDGTETTAGGENTAEAQAEEEKAAAPADDTADSADAGSAGDAGEDDTAGEPEAEVVDKGGEEAAPATTDAVAVKPEAGAVTTPGKIVLAYTDFENAMPILDYGILAKFYGNSGVIMNGDGKTLGTEITLEIMSWRYTYQITPNDDSDDAGDYVRYSDDGKHLNETMQDIKEYIAENKEAWPRISCKKYVELTGMLISANGADADEFMEETIQISMAPQSRKAFENHRMQMMVKIRTKRIDAVPTLLNITAQPAKSNKKDYTKLITK